MTELSLGNIEEAARVVEPAFRNTPQFREPTLSERLGRELVVKIETLNPLGSFKGRGTDYYLHGVEGGQEVVCASAGNFGQGIAYAGAKRDSLVTVFTATNANPGKVARMRALGADVRQVGADFDAAKDAAREYAREPGRLFVEDGEAPAIAEGAGTIAAELAPLGLDTILVPVGNGSLISGIGRYLRAHSPRTRVIGICAAGAPAMERSWRAGRPISTEAAHTSADGIAVRVPVPVSVRWTREYVDDMVLVGEEFLVEGLRLARDTLGMLLEPSAVAGFAALLQHDLPGETAGTIITGRNYSQKLLAELTSA
ncbi:threonine ammonia-lyase [Amycolatopsis anabasis]|uniref:threonine ammonia-lyase n=1 Tax=Amycolatopsis anabasis TaxID=1840409 RepID=UPI00131CC107|nr:pyridoxal-phosphate dependent enzyme [Amycolatopsis anabasis]